MRIDFSASEAAETIGVAAAGTAGEAPGATGSSSSELVDTATLSPASAMLSALSSQALSSAGARATHVDALRGAVANGTFVASPDRIADALAAGDA